MIELFHERKNDVLLYRGAPLELERVTTAVQQARRLNGEYVAVPRTLHNSQLLRLLGLPVVPVMTDETYDWPAAPGIKPYQSQKLTANFLTLHPRSFVLSDLGTGKTLSALWAADWLMRQHAPGSFRALIVCPLSVMSRVWGDAIFKNFLNRRSFIVLYGDAGKRQKLLDTPADFYVLNHDGVGIGAHTRKKFELDGFSKQLAHRSDIKLVIADEASAYRDSRTKRHRIAREVIGRRDYLWMLTATPTPNAPTDAYGLARLVNKAGGRSFQTFQNETMIKVSQFKWVPQKDGFDKARRLLAPSIRVDIREIWDGPPLTTQQREVALTDQQKKLLADLKRDLQIVVKSGHPITAANEAAARQKFLQIVLGAVYDESHAWHAVEAEPRYREVEDIVEQAARKIVCFIGLTSVIERVYARLSKRWKVAVINGDVSKKERDLTISQFASDPELRAVVCDPQCTSHGINEFVHADTALWVGPTDKNELYTQGNGRIYRPGQKHPATIIQLVSTGLEKEIFKRLETRASMQGLLLDAVRRGEL